LSDPRFFQRAGPFTLAQIAERVGGELVDDQTAANVVSDIAPLEDAQTDQLSFFDNKRYLDVLAASTAGACLIAKAMLDRAPHGMALIRCADPYLAFAKAAQLFYPPLPPEAGIAETAAIEDGAEIGEGCRIDHQAVVLAGARLGARCHVEAGALIGRGVVLGDDCVIGHAATVEYSVLGNRVHVYAGARVGTEGFGFAIGPEGAVRIPHTGRVIVEDDVEIGANTTVDRGTAGDTFIGRGSMIDNQVQIAHNVRIGRGCILAGQVGLAGSVQVGDYAMLGGKAGVANHVKIGERARLGAFSGTNEDMEPGVTYLGAPAMPGKDFWRQMVALRRLSKKG
jgi:UDP-3-O-[3-hydroxymyristoyl] glucosamine N-acyltransferase